jgi:hypothetical protein
LLLILIIINAAFNVESLLKAKICYQKIGRFTGKPPGFGVRELIAKPVNIFGRYFFGMWRKYVTLCQRKLRFNAIGQ